ncbi:hypothetical protein ACXVUM_03200 [Williamsia sp. SKLECPSW1]
MTTPRGPRGNRRPRVAGRPATRPTGPDRPTSRPAGEDAQQASGDSATTPVEPSPPKAPRRPKKRTPATPEPAESTTSAETGTDTASTDTASTDSETAADSATTPADTTTAAETSQPVDTTKRVDTTKPPVGPRGKSRPAVKVSTIKPQATRPAPRTSPAGTAPTSTSTTRRRRFGWRAVGVIAAIAALVGIVAGVAAARPGVSLSNNEAFVDPAVTSQVTAQAKSRICSVFAVNYAKLDDWERTAKANVTGEASNRFTQYAGAVRDALGQTGLTQGGVDCRVDTVGVRSITGDTATLVVNLILSQTEGEQANGSGTKRYQVTMQRVDGQWLISNFSDF